MTGDERYLDLLKKCLCRYDLEGAHRYEPVGAHRTGVAGRAQNVVIQAVKRAGLELVRPLGPANLEDRTGGLDWPVAAETMIGMRRLNNLHECVEDVIRNKVPGDIIETGVWRGGACILARAILAVHDQTDRTVWVADSFQGVPKPDSAYPADEQDILYRYPELAISLKEVQANFARYGMLDDQVRFLEGWFKDTLPDAPIDKIAVLRLDGDLYESTIQALEALYPKLQPGGYVIVDDYGIYDYCRQAVTDYRDAHGITDDIHVIDTCGVYWQRAT